MLILRRKEGQWVEVTHRSGDVLRVLVRDVRPGGPGQVNLGWEDPDHHFVIQRPERALPAAVTEPPSDALVY